MTLIIHPRSDATTGENHVIQYNLMWNDLQNHSSHHQQ